MLFVCERTVLSPTTSASSDTRAIKVRREQPKDIKLPLAERLPPFLAIHRPTTATSEGAEQASDVLGRDTSPGRRREHLRHGGALAHERSNVALRLCQRQRATERLEPCGAATAPMLGQRLQVQDLDDAPPPPARFGGDEQPLEKCDRFLDRARIMDPGPASQEHPRERDVLVLAHVGEVVIH